MSKRLERLDEGSWTDLKNLRESCSQRSASLGMTAQYNALMYRHVISVAVNDHESSPFYCFKLVNLCSREQVIPNWGRIFQYRPDYPGVEMKQLVLEIPVRLNCLKNRVSELPWT